MAFVVPGLDSPTTTETDGGANNVQTARRGVWKPATAFYLMIEERGDSTIREGR